MWNEKRYLKLNKLGASFYNRKHTDDWIKENKNKNFLFHLKQLDKTSSHNLICMRISMKWNLLQYQHHIYLNCICPLRYHNIKNVRANWDKRKTSFFLFLWDISLCMRRGFSVFGKEHSSIYRKIYDNKSTIRYFNGKPTELPKVYANHWNGNPRRLIKIHLTSSQLYFKYRTKLKLWN